MWSYFSLQMVNDELVTYAIPQIEIKLKTFLVEYHTLIPDIPPNILNWLNKIEYTKVW